MENGEWRIKKSVFFIFTLSYLFLPLFTLFHPFSLFFTPYLTAGELDNIDISMDLEDVDKPYSYKGYIKPELYYIDDKDKYKEIKTELNLEGDYKKNEWYLKGNWSGYYINDEKDKQTFGVMNELYVKYGNVNKNLTAGKELLKWGKGYAYSAVSFFTRPKNPLYPEDLKQGYELVHFKTITATDTAVKNYSLDLIYMPVTDTLNSDLQKSQNTGAKLYMLYKNIDIDLMFRHSNAEADLFGGDFSFNILTELEAHGEYAVDSESNSSYLIGLKYAGDYDYTVTAEWYKDWNGNKFVYGKVSRKDFCIDYLTAYVTGIRNYKQNMNSLLIGGNYDFKNNFITTLEYLTSTKQKYIKFTLGYYF
jgi:hypothetical protein